MLELCNIFRIEITMRKGILLLISFIVFSCASHEPSSKVLELDEGIPVVAKEYKNELIITNPLDLAVIDNKLVLFMHSGEKPLLIVNPDDGTLTGSWGEFGNGPDEFTAPTYWGHDKSKQELYLYDVNYRVLRVYRYQAAGDSLSFNRIREVAMSDEIMVNCGTVLDNSNIVTSVLFFGNAPIQLLDKDLRTLSGFGWLSEQGDSSTDMRTFKGRLSSYKNSFAFGMDGIGYLAFYNQTDTTAYKEWEVYLDKPLYVGDRLDLKKVKQGFLDIEVTKHYVICSYCGKPYSREDGGFYGYNILVFDHDGDLVHNLKLDRKIGRIAVSDDEKTVYAVAYEPDICIVRYTLNDL